MGYKSRPASFIYCVWVVAASYCTLWGLGNTIPASLYCVRTYGMGSAFGHVITFILSIIIAGRIVGKLKFWPFIFAAVGAMLGSSSAVFITYIMSENLPFSGKYSYLFIAVCAVAGHILNRHYYGWRIWVYEYFEELEIKHIVLTGICYGYSVAWIMESFCRDSFLVETSRLTKPFIFIASIASVTILYTVIHNKAMEIVRRIREKKDAEYREFFEEWIRNKKEKEESEPLTGYAFFAGCTKAGDLKKRYREMCKIYHPDNCPGHEAEFKAVNEEYARLRYMTR